MKYMVMECHPGYAVVLDEEGRFLKVANRNYEVGQTVTEIIEMNIPQTGQGKRKTGRWKYSAAAVAACLVLMVTSAVQFGQMTVASVYMTINPEVRIDVNRSDRVVGLEGINPDGKELISGYSYKSKDLDIVMDSLVDRAIDMGFLCEGGEIELLLDADNEEWVVDHSSALTEHLDEYLSEKLTVTIEVSGKKSGGEQIVIPVVSGDSDYGESDYVEIYESDYNESDHSDSESAYGNSDYFSEDSGYGSEDYSNYGDDDSVSDSGYGSYEESDYETDNSSEYEDSDYE